MDNSLVSTNIENSDTSLDWKPRIGMHFDSEQSAYDFYKRYGQKVGFNVRRETSGRNRRTKELTSRLFVCGKEGVRSEDKRDLMIRKPRAETRTSCQASLSIKLNRSSNTFCIYHFVDDHNHSLWMKECSHMLHSQQNIHDSQPIEIDSTVGSGVEISNSLVARNIENSDLCLDWKPRIGMEFDYEESAHDFYSRYGEKEGFRIRRESCGKNKRTKELTSRLFVCCKEGIRSKDKRDAMTRKPRAKTRTGCQASLSVKLNRSSHKFFVYHFVEEHNHSLEMRLFSQKLPSKRKRHSSETRAVNSRHEGKSLFQLMDDQAGGRDVFRYTKVDVNKYLCSKRQKGLDYGEFEYIIKYFSNKVLENPSFYHAMQLDNEEHITNIFWADATMIINYGQFGDVVSFDTTYKMNKSNLPLVMFVGFNHHRETIIFGVALMYDETVDSFIWLFGTFLRAMSRRAPKSILTDQDAELAKALHDVMPETYHMLCKWHMLQNAIKHGHGCLTEEGGITTILSRFMEDIEEEDEFTSAWDAMLEIHGACDDSWLCSAYNLRAKWGFPYVKGVWSAGVKTTQLNESFNSSLKRYLDTDHDMSTFFTHFESMISDIRYKEEYDYCFSLPIVKIHIKMLYEARKIYTKPIFEEFQDQFELSLEASITNCIDGDGGKIYTLTGDSYRSVRKVKRDSDDMLFCSCKLFEMKGVVCSHIIKVLREVMQLKEISGHYILKRWTNEAKGENVLDLGGCEIQADPKLQQASWYRSLCATYNRILSRASGNEKAWTLVMRNAETLAKEIEYLLQSEMSANVDDSGVIIQSTHVQELNSDGNEVLVSGLRKGENSRGRSHTKSQMKINMNTNEVQRSNHDAIKVTPDLPHKAQDDTLIPYNAYLVTLDQLSNAEHGTFHQTSDADQIL